MPDPTPCPATHSVDTGDWAEPVECELPIEHNALGSWHQAGWKSADEEISVRWAPEIGEHSRWPRPTADPMDPLSVAFYRERILNAILEPNRLLERMPVHVGSNADQRKWVRP